MFNIATLFTLFRILIIPFMVAFYFMPVPWGHLAATMCFVIAALTDWLDGFLARKLSLSTRFGAFLDPVADKVLVATAIVILVAAHGHFYLAIPAMVIIGREIVVSALREWMAEIGKRQTVSVMQLGKVKTTLQMISLTVLLYCTSTTADWLFLLGVVFLYISAAITLWSMICYMKAAWPDLTLSEET